MKRVVLSLLFLCPSSFLGAPRMASEYPSLIASYLDSVQMDSREQHNRVGRALLSLEGMEREELVSVMGYLCMVLQVPDVEVDGGCDCCCDVDELIDKEFATCDVGSRV